MTFIPLLGLLVIFMSSPSWQSRSFRRQKKMAASLSPNEYRSHSSVVIIIPWAISMRGGGREYMNLPLCFSLLFFCFTPSQCQSIVLTFCPYTPSLLHIYPRHLIPSTPTIYPHFQSFSSPRCIARIKLQQKVILPRIARHHEVEQLPFHRGRNGGRVDLQLHCS